ncbi:class I SAM-dependent RNA methyltransferase [Paenirhodobacter populi]|uniref:class I SAM-dependent RNA methyltransferase n=1 Tax=Paenirhodobacter populi TaxID=2306993 RepID=UPI000FE3E13E|nr:class I SAM-dependent RNA methyltransferase [Sinirhodobacter populi]RWR04790.1 class I SAM-dependent RNA methyltransferase [Sinirhodobacter populi]
MPLTIERLSLHADGVARGPDGVIHVAMALPGEVVEGDVLDGRISAPKILTASPDRVRAPCPHYRACGGCVLQHGSDAFVAGWKADVVRQALAQRGIAAEIAAVETSPLRSRRRATFAGRRTKKGTLVGFHARASDTLVEVPGCLILRPELLSAVPALREATALGASRKGEVGFALTLSGSGIEVAAKAGKEMDPPLFEALAGLSRRHDLVRLSWNGETIAARRPAEQSFGRARVTPPPGAFLQATAEGEAALVAFVRRAVGDAARVADLFAGCGTFALPLAERAEVHAVEGFAQMLEALDRGWRESQGLKRVTHEARDLFRRPLLPDEIDRHDAIVIDPPRAGAEAQVREIAASHCTRLAYVSCNPVTFARDARLLTDAGFRLEPLIVVDQFRWSDHVELAALFLRD